MRIRQEKEIRDDNKHYCSYSPVSKYCHLHIELQREWDQFDQPRRWVPQHNIFNSAIKELQRILLIPTWGKLAM